MVLIEVRLLRVLELEELGLCPGLRLLERGLVAIGGCFRVALRLQLQLWRLARRVVQVEVILRVVADFIFFFSLEHLFIQVEELTEVARAVKWLLRCTTIIGGVHEKVGLAVPGAALPLLPTAVGLLGSLLRAGLLLRLAHHEL